MEADVIFDTMRAIILDVTGVPECLKTEPNAPAPDGEYCTVSISSNVSQRGQSIVNTPTASPGSVEVEVLPQAVTEVSINFYRGNAADNAQKMLQANKLPSVSEKLYKAKLGWQRAGPVNKITGLQAAAFESRAQVSVYLWHEIQFPDRDPEVVYTIEQVPYKVWALGDNGAAGNVAQPARVRTARNTESEQPVGDEFDLVSEGVIGNWASVPVWDTIPSLYDRQSWLPVSLDLNDYVRPHPQQLPLSNWVLNNAPPEITVDSNGIVTVSALANIGAYDISASVDNAFGTGTSNPWTWNITLHDAPVWDLVPPWNVEEDALPVTREMNDYILEGGNLYGWSVAGDPPGVTIDANGVITVSDSTATGSYSLTCTVINEYGPSTCNAFALSIALSHVPDPPVWTGTPIPDQSHRDASLPVTLDVKLYLVPNSLPLTWALSGAPAGITIGSNGIITVADTTAIGSYSLQVLVSNDDGTDVPSNIFTWGITEYLSPSWSAIPDIYGDKSGSYPISVNMNLYASGDELSDWTINFLGDPPAGVSVGTNGLLTVASNATPGQHDMSVSVSNPGGTETSAGFSLFMDGAATGIPAVTGDQLVGGVLTAQFGTLADVNGLPSIADVEWQWIRDGQNIVGANGRTYTLTGEDGGTVIRVVASFTDGHGFREGPFVSVAGPVIDLPATGKPEITGNVYIGQTLTANIGTITDVSGVPDISTFLWQWYKDGSPIAGEINQTYDIRAEDDGSVLRVDASFVDGAGFSEGPLSSDNTSPVGGTAEGQPDITGTAAVGQTLTAGIGTITDINGVPDISEFDWQWYRSGVAILNAQSRTYLVVSQDGNEVLRVDASFVDLNGFPEGPLASDETVVVSAPASGRPSITGQAEVGGELTAGIGSISDPNGVPAIGAFSWKWYSDGVEIPGEVGQTYVVRFGDVGSVIRVDASFTDLAGYAEGPIESLDTGVVPPSSSFSHDFTTSNLGDFAFTRPGDETGPDYAAQQITVGADVPMFVGGQWVDPTWADKSVGYGLQISEPLTTDATYQLSDPLPEQGLKNNFTVLIRFIYRGPALPPSVYSNVLWMHSTTGGNSRSSIAVQFTEKDGEPGTANYHLVVPLDYESVNSGAYHSYVPQDGDRVTLRFRKRDYEVSLGDGLTSMLKVVRNGTTIIDETIYGTERDGITPIDCSATFDHFIDLISLGAGFNARHTQEVQDIDILPYAETDENMAQWGVWSHPSPILAVEPQDVVLGDLPGDAAAIVTSPESKVVVEGADITVGATATGTAPLTWLWETRLSGQNWNIASNDFVVSGENTNVLRIIGSTETQPFDVRATVTNAENPTGDTSEAATITTVAAPIVSSALSLLYTDAVNGVNSGWHDDATKGAAITLYGTGFDDTTLANNTITFSSGGVDRVIPSSHIVEAISSPVPWVQQLTFHLWDQLPEGNHTITVGVGGEQTEGLSFYVRSTGRHVFIDADYDDGNGSSDGSFDRPWKQVYEILPFGGRDAGLNQAGDHIYLKGGTTNDYIPGGNSSGRVIHPFGGRGAYGTSTHGIHYTSYPGTGLAKLDARGSGHPKCIEGLREYNAELQKDYYVFSKFDMYGDWQSADLGGGDHTRLVGAICNGVNVYYQGAGDVGWGGENGNNNIKVFGTVSRNGWSGRAPDHAFYPGGGGSKFGGTEYAYNWVYDNYYAAGPLLSFHYKDLRVKAGEDLQPIYVHHNLIDCRMPAAHPQYDNGQIRGFYSTRGLVYNQMGGQRADEDQGTGEPGPFYTYQNVFISDPRPPVPGSEGDTGRGEDSDPPGSWTDSRQSATSSATDDATQYFLNNTYYDIPPAGAFNEMGQGYVLTHHQSSFVFSGNVLYSTSPTNSYCVGGWANTNVSRVGTGNIYYGGDGGTTYSEEPSPSVDEEPLGLTFTDMTAYPSYPVITMEFESTINNAAPALPPGLPGATRDIWQTPMGTQTDSGAVKSEGDTE